MLALWRPSPGVRKIGFAVSRQVRTTVGRNRVRRRLREAYRRQRAVFPQDLAIVFVGRPAALTAAFEELLDDMAEANAVVTGRAGAERGRRAGTEGRG